jgi:hypothetical protein
MWHVGWKSDQAVRSKLEPLPVRGEGDATLEHEHADRAGRSVFAQVRSGIQNGQDNIHAWITNQRERIASMRADWRVGPQFGELSTKVVPVKGHGLRSFGSRLIGVAVEHGDLRGMCWHCELEAVNGVVFAFGLLHQIGKVVFPSLESADGLKNLLHRVRSLLRICARDWVARDWVARVCVNSGIAFNGVVGWSAQNDFLV